MHIYGAMRHAYRTEILYYGSEEVYGEEEKKEKPVLSLQYFSSILPACHQMD